MTRLETIETRLAAIAQELSSEDADKKTSEELDALEKEVRSLQEEKKNIMDAAQKRASIEKEIAEGKVGVDITPDIFGVKKNMEERKFDAASIEYRNAWLKNIRGNEMEEVEKRALTTVMSSAGAATPTTTVNKIIEKVKQTALVLCIFLIK